MKSNFNSEATFRKLKQPGIDFANPGLNSPDFPSSGKQKEDP